MNIRNNRWPILLVSVFAILSFGACTKMDDTYSEFLEGGMKVYIGKIDTVFVYPGNERLQLGWLPPSDPKSTKARVFWNNGRDSVDIPIIRTEDRSDTIKVMFNNMTEGTYVFEVYTLDEGGRRSLKTEAVARVYGDNYNAGLLGRPIDTYLLSEEEDLQITWGAAPDPTMVGSEIFYEDISGEQVKVFVPLDAPTTIIENFKPQTLTYRSLYLPSPLAIDTFYTEDVDLRIKGKPIELSKAGWTAETSSFDDRSGSNYRPGSNAIDENEATIWVNKTTAPTNVYPHTITVDMKQVYHELEGFAIVTRVGDAAARPRTVELSTSLDGINWTLHIVLDLANSGDRQFIPIPEGELVSARYFRLHATSSFSGGNIALAEVGMYYR